MIACLRFLLLTLFLDSSAAAQSSHTDLEQWQDWVADRHDNLSCPWQMGKETSRVCVWPGSLELEVNPGGLDFRFTVEVFQEQATVALPGSNEHWPSSVTVNGKTGLVVEREDTPGIILDQGKHVLEGHISWQRRPGSIRVPRDIALVKLVEGGQSRPVNRRENQVVLARSKSVERPEQQNAIAVEVFRKLSDGVPMRLETQLVLSVSGESREVTLGQLVWEGTEVVSLNSPLPSRIENDGSMRVQVIAGKHSITLHSRFHGLAEQIKTVRQGNDWPAFEYLSFAGNSNLRQIRITGAPSIDTSQAPIPAHWLELPTYRLDGESVLSLQTEYRGDHSPTANQLSVHRNLWLDFKGGGLTGLETVSGAMYRDWRLNAQPDTTIGRARVAEHPVLVTDHAGAQGIEIRSPDIRLSAVTRIASPTVFSAVGWDARADSYAARLHTPPGWRVLHATGVDNITGTWVNRWDLWDIFLLLIVVTATRKMLGIKVAALAAIALVAGYHESGMPIFFYPALLLFIPLLPVVSGRTKRIVTALSLIICAGLTLTLLDYAVTTFRVAIYPSLERENVGRYSATSYDSQFSSARFAESEVGVADTAGLSDDLAQVARAAAPIAKMADRKGVVPPPDRRKLDLYHLGEHDRVQTGPGTPVWLWQFIDLQSTGPVPATTRLSLTYSPPWLTSIWRVLSVLLAVAYGAILVLTILRRCAFVQTVSPTKGSSGAALAIVLAFVALTTAPGDSVAAEFPPKHLLDELEARLVEPPDCAPHCISLDQGELVSTKDQLVITFQAYAAADMLLQLPTAREGWQVTDIEIDASDDVRIRNHQGYTAIAVPGGHHEISMRGDLLGDMVTLSVPVPIHNLRVSGDEWLASGLVDGRLPSGTLSLRAKAGIQKEEADTLIQDPVVPFVIVSREFFLGTQWRMSTIVRRLAPVQGPLSVKVPLLAFEQALSSSINFSDGEALLQFSENQQEIRWESALQPMDQMTLTASSGEHYLETWRIVPSALWRAEYEGIPPVKESAGLSSLQPFWRPWPAEQLDIRFHRPTGVSGPTYTVEEATLNYEGGSNVRKSTLTLKILASLGQDYTVGLPENASVQSIRRNGVSLNRPQSNQVKVVLQPGEQTIEIEFQQDGEFGWLGQTPSIDLPSGASNITLSYALPHDRWPLYLTGPPIGPAMLYWGVFCVIVLSAIILSLLARRLGMDLPIGLVGWLLLGIGLSTVNSYGVIITAIFFFLLAYRQSMEPDSFSRRQFNGVQLLIGLWTGITILCLLAAIPMGLLSSPNMIVTGNGSWSHFFKFFQDRAAADSFPVATVLSVSLLVYRITMLVWSLWLANRLISWAKWWWNAYSHNGVWRHPVPAKGAGEALVEENEKNEQP